VGPFEDEMVASLVELLDEQLEKRLEGAVHDVDRVDAQDDHGAFDTLGGWDQLPERRQLGEEARPSIRHHGGLAGGEPLWDRHFLQCPSSV